MEPDLNMTLADIKIQLADSVLEAACLRRELAKAQKLIQQLQRDNQTHKETIVSLQGVGNKIEG